MKLHKFYPQPKQKLAVFCVYCTTRDPSFIVYKILRIDVSFVQKDVTKCLGVLDPKASTLSLVAISSVAILLVLYYHANLKLVL